MALSQEHINELKDIANKLRIHSIQSTDASKSGHPTSCSSIAEILSVLFFNTLRLTIKEPRHKSSDRFVLSKGHAAPILYAAWAEAGLFPAKNLMDLRKITSDLEGHPTPRLNFIDVATGSLGQGLSVGCGMAYTGKYFDKASYRVYVLIGDGESAEGSIWEAMAFASFYKLDNLVAIFDINRLGQSDPTQLQHDVDVYAKRCEAFGFHPIIVDGHMVPDLVKAFKEASETKSKPTAIIAMTYKGRDFPSIENLENWHGKPLGTKSTDVIKHIESTINNTGPHKLKVAPIVDDAPAVNITNIKLSSSPSYKAGEKVATRQAYGNALYKLAQGSNRVIALDGDTKNSTFSCRIMEVNKEQYIECFIAEQNLVGVATGVACRDRAVTFVSTFACFLSRAFDQIRMGAISQSNVNFVGSHCGVSIGEDGPSQMGLEDLALFRSIPGCTVFYPSDAVSCERAVELAANTKGMCYIRTSRPATPMVYSNDTKFKIGECHVVYGSGKGGEQALIIAAGVTLHEALKAASQLNESGVMICVVDPFTVKPLDVNIIKYAKACGNNVLVVEDHYPEGGLGDAVRNLLSEEVGVRVRCLAVREVPRSGPPDVLLDKYGISSKHIINDVCDIVKK